MARKMTRKMLKIKKREVELLKTVLPNPIGKKKVQDNYLTQMRNRWTLLLLINRLSNS